MERIGEKGGGRGRIGDGRRKGKIGERGRGRGRIGERGRKERIGDSRRKRKTRREWEEGKE